MKRAGAHGIILAVLVLIASTSARAIERQAVSEGAATADRGSTALDVSGVTGLLDVLDALAAEHPDYADESRRIESMGEAERRAALDAKAAANASNGEINRAIDTLYVTSAYRLYFMQFRNVSSEVHRRILLALPYEAINSPADISRNLRELWFNRDAVRAWVDDAFSKVDLDRCRDEATRWLPKGEYEVPPVYFFYDGNGDAFARLGAVCFDLYGLVFRKRPPESRFDDLANLDVAQIEPVLAHEFHHVFAGSIPRGQKPPGGEWQDQRKSELASRIVSEGVAMRCDVGEGLRRDAMEDTATVAFWIGQLNGKFAQLEAGTLSNEQWQRWLGTTYYDLARELLREYLATQNPGADIDAMMRHHSAARPSLVYTLGWWMISRILEDPDGRERVLALLSDPDRVFAEYNRSIGEDAPPGLRVTGL